MVSTLQLAGNLIPDTLLHWSLNVILEVSLDALCPSLLHYGHINLSILIHNGEL